MRLGALIVSAPIIDFQTCLRQNASVNRKVESIVCERNTLLCFAQQNNANTVLHGLRHSGLIPYPPSIAIILWIVHGE
jgi:hypothetical protein